MAVTVGVLSETRRGALEALCDTFAPALDVAAGSEALRAFYARSASDMGIAAQIEGLLAQTALPEEIEALGQLLDAFAAHNLAELATDARTALVQGIAASASEAKLGVRQLRAKLGQYGIDCVHEEFEGGHFNTAHRYGRSLAVVTAAATRG